MAFCCCKKSKHVEGNEVKEVKTGLLYEEKEEHDQPTTSDTKPKPFVAMQVKGLLDVGENYTTGVAKLNGSIYILCRNPSSILIHRDVPPFDRAGEVSLENLEAPNDMASSAKASCLYVTDCKSNSVYKVTLPSHEVSSWIEGIGYPHTLTVACPDDQVLLVKCGSPSSLEVYGTDAAGSVKVRSIQLPNELEYPKHAVRTSGGSYIVSGKAKESEAWGVFELNVEGDILRRLTRDTPMTESYHLAIDSADRIVVADCWHHRLLSIDAQLSHSEELPLRNCKGLRWPWRLQYIASDNQMLVLQHDGKMGKGGVVDGEKDEEDEGKTKTGEGGVETPEKVETVKDEEREKGTAEEEKMKNGVEVEKATAEEKKADAEEDVDKIVESEKKAEKIEGEQKKEDEIEQEKKGEEKNEQEEQMDRGHALVYICGYI